MFSIEQLFKLDILTRLRWIAGSGAISLFSIAIARAFGLLHTTGFFYLEIASGLILGSFALFAPRFAVAVKHPNACLFWAGVPAQIHFLRLSYLRDVEITTLIAFAIFMISGAIALESALWRRVCLASFSLGAIGMAWSVSEPQIPAMSVTLIFFFVGLLTFVMTEALYSARRVSTEALRLLEETQSFSGVGGWHVNFLTGEFRWTDTTANLLDYQPKDANVFRLQDVIIGNHNESPLLKAVWRLQNKGEEYDLVEQVRTKSGRQIHVRMLGKVIERNGRPYRGLGVLTDITEQIAREEELTQAKEAAEQAAKSRSQFLAAMSHEIRTPMNGVLGMASLLGERSLDAESQMLVSMVEQSGESLLHIINDILDFSKLSAGKMPLEQLPFDLATLIDSATITISTSAAEKGLKLNKKLRQASDSNFLGDEQRLRQVLVNLLSNALKFTSAGSITISVVETVVDAQSSELAFAVTDSGIGIDESKQASLFDAFTQADSSTTREYGGTGLGLSISHQLVSQMGGRLHVESIKGSGATFAFTIALQRVAIEDAAQETPLSCQDLDPDLRILLVEDNVVNQKVALKMLHKLGYSADVAVNGLEAVDAVERKTYDLILMDLQMPELDGFGATQRIRALPGTHQPHIVALTANAMREDEQQCLEAGMDQFLAKPIRLPDLTRTLAQYPGQDSRQYSGHISG